MPLTWKPCNRQIELEHSFTLDQKPQNMLISEGHHMPLAWEGNNEKEQENQRESAREKERELRRDNVIWWWCFLAACSICPLKRRESDEHWQELNEQIKTPSTQSFSLFPHRPESRRDGEEIAGRDVLSQEPLSKARLIG